MAISIQCPQCGKSYNLRDDLAGKRVKCKCGQALAVPQPAASEAYEDLGAGSDGLSDLFDEALPPATGGAALGGGLGNLAQTPMQPVLAPARRPSKDSGMSPLVLTAIIGGGAAVLLFIGLMIFLMTGSKETTAAGDPGEPGSAESTETLPGFATPQEAFAALQKATVDKDWAAQLAVHAPESRERLVGAVAYSTLMLSQMSEPNPKIVAILKKHGIDESVSVQQPSATQMANMEKEQRKLAAMIEDKSAFFVELMPAMETVGAEMASKLPGMAASREKAEQMQEQAQKAQAEAKLIDVQITGDTAQGKRQMPFQGRTVDVPVYFRSIDQRWYIHQPTAQEAMEMGRKIGQAIKDRMGQEGGPPNAP